VTTKKNQRNAKTKVGKTKLALGKKTVKAKTAAEKKNKNQKKQTARVTGTERANQLAEKVDQEDNNDRDKRLAKIRESIPVDDY
jgi:hypothetical protein